MVDFSSIANQIFNQLDTRDARGADGIIGFNGLDSQGKEQYNASIWNDYASNFGGKTVKDCIKRSEAINSIINFFKTAEANKDLEQTKKIASAAGVDPKELISSIMAEIQQNMPVTGAGQNQPVMNPRNVGQPQIIPDDQVDPQLKETVNQAVTTAKEYLSANPDLEFDAPGGKKVKASDLLEIIDKIQYDNDSWGSARANRQQSPEDSSIIVSAENNKTTSVTSMTKLLIHEALHYAFNSIQDTQEEERLCETQAIKTTSELVHTGKLEDDNIYGLSYSTIQDDELSAQITNWINQAYSGRPTDISGNINLNGTQISNGDEVWIGGERRGTVGNEFYIDSPNSQVILLQDVQGGRQNRTTRLGTEENQNSVKIEIKRNGTIIYSANGVNPRQ